MIFAAVLELLGAPILVQHRGGALLGKAKGLVSSSVPEQAPDF